ncbi:MAG: hypothetical protein ACLRMW_01115 [[Clostridium] symbiosum]
MIRMERIHCDGRAFCRRRGTAFLEVKIRKRPGRKNQRPDLSGTE